MSRTKKSKPLVLLIENDLPMRRYLKLFLTGKGYAFMETDTGEDGIVKVSTEKPDLVLLDVGLPDIDGLEVTKRIREVSDVPMIVISERDSERDKVELLFAGADDYLTKPFGAEELHARAQVALRRSAAVVRNCGASVISFDGVIVDLAKHQVFMDDKEIHLTPTEYRLLRTLLNNAGKAVSYNDLMADISLSGKGDSAAYVRVYTMQLRRKLERQPDKPKHLISVPGFGVRLDTSSGGNASP